MPKDFQKIDVSAVKMLTMKRQTAQSMHPSPLSQSSLDQASNSKIQLFQKLPDTSYPFQIQSLTFHKVEGNLGLGQYAPLSQIAWRSTVGWNEKHTADHDFLMSYIFGFLKMNLTSFKKYLHTGIGEILDLERKWFIFSISSWRIEFSLHWCSRKDDTSVNTNMMKGSKPAKQKQKGCQRFCQYLRSYNWYAMPIMIAMQIMMSPAHLRWINNTTIIQ